MSSQNKIVAVLAGVIGVLLLVLGISLRWPAWVTALAVAGSCVIVIVVAVIVTVAGRERQIPLPQQPIHLPPPPAPEPPPVQMAAVQGVNLTSAWPDYEFVFDATVYWRIIDGATVTAHVRPGATAVEMIIRRAAEVAASEVPGMAVRLQHRLNDVLGNIEGDPSGRIVAWADQVRTMLSESDFERLRDLSDIRKNKVVWEHQRRFERDKRDYLTGDVLKSTGSAVVWWLSRNDTKVTDAVDLIGTMARLSAAAKNEDVSELFRHLVPESALPPLEPEQPSYPTVDLGSTNGARSATDFVTGLMDAMHLDRDERAQFADRLAMNIATTGNDDVAQQIRERFDVIPEQFTDDEEPESEESPTPEPDAFMPED